MKIVCVCVCVSRQMFFMFLLALIRSHSKRFSHLLATTKNHEIKCLLFGRKVMTNLDSILKSKDITLRTKVHLVKAMVFPVVMYGRDSWTVKKAERQRINAFKLWC